MCCGWPGATRGRRERLVFGSRGAPNRARTTRRGVVLEVTRWPLGVARPVVGVQPGSTRAARPLPNSLPRRIAVQEHLEHHRRVVRRHPRGLSWAARNGARSSSSTRSLTKAGRIDPVMQAGRHQQEAVLVARAERLRAHTRFSHPGRAPGWRLPTRAPIGSQRPGSRPTRARPTSATCAPPSGGSPSRIIGDTVRAGQRGVGPRPSRSLGSPWRGGPLPGDALTGGIV